MENKIEREFKVPEHGIQWLDKEFAKLNKRAKKLGVAEVTYTIIGEETKTITHNEKGEKLEIPEYRIFKIIKVEGEAPKFEGWEFLGRLDHNDEHGNIFSAVPGKTIPEQYRNVSRYSCDHCNKNIYRKDTFVVQHEEGEVKQVGRQCIRDFLGHKSPENIAKWAEWWIRFEGWIQDEEDGEWGGGAGGEKWWEKTYDLEGVLTYSVACIREYGWVSGREARDDHTKVSTSNRVTDNIIDRYKKLKNWREADQLVYPTDEDKEFAKIARAWVQEMDPEGNDYLGNLKVIASQDYVNGKQWGLAVSMISAYKRHVEKRELAKRTNKKNEWFGEVKDKVELTVQVIRVFEIEGRYGVTYLHKMLTDDGYSVDWWCSNYNNSMDQGYWYKIKGTITDHIEYNDWKSTKLTRCKVLEEINVDNLEGELITDEDINLEEK